MQKTVLTVGGLPCIQARAATVTRRQDGILHVLWAQDGEISGQDAAEVMAASIQLATAKRFLVYADLTGTRVFTREARAYFASDESHALATALLVGSPLSKIMGNFMMGMNKAKFPTRIFTEEAAAIAWLTSFTGDI